MQISTISLKAANEYVIRNHRHHGSVRGHKFSLALYDNDELCGVAIVGRPVSRILDDGSTLEVLRLCTNGKKNACSMLYARCARAAEILGYRKIVTYILQSENGASLRASGWKCVSEKCGATKWNSKRSLKNNHIEGYKAAPEEMKKRYEKEW